MDLLLLFLYFILNTNIYQNQSAFQRRSCNFDKMFVPRKIANFHLQLTTYLKTFLYFSSCLNANQNANDM